MMSTCEKPSFIFPKQQLTIEWEVRANLELNESEYARENACNRLRTLLSAETNLRTRMDDEFLLRFLRATKFCVTRAHTMIKRYFSVKKKNPELCVVPRASDVMNLLAMGMQTVLKERTEKGCCICIFRLDKVDLNAISVDEIFMTNMMCAEALSLDPMTQVAGLVCIIDLLGFSFPQHACFFSPHYASRTVNMVQGSFPLRFKQFHVINEPFYFGAVYALLKPFLKEKIRKRIFFHGGNMESVHKYIDPRILPSDYGGAQPELDNSDWRKRLLELDDWFSELKSYGYI